MSTTGFVVWSYIIKFTELASQLYMSFVIEICLSNNYKAMLWTAY